MKSNEQLLEFPAPVQAGRNQDPALIGGGNCSAIECLVMDATAREAIIQRVGPGPLGTSECVRPPIRDQRRPSECRSRRMRSGAPTRRSPPNGTPGLACLWHEKQFDGYGPAGPRWYGPSRVTSSTINIGKLIVSIVDPAKRQLVWRGDASKTVSLNKDPDKNYRQLEKTVSKLFKNYPTPAKT